MSRYLSNSNIEMIESFIQTNKALDTMPNISETDREQTIVDWMEINKPETQCHTYLQFASNAYGMTSYGFYKTKNDKIFIIEAYCGEVKKYYNVDSSWVMLIPYEEFMKQLFEVKN